MILMNKEKKGYCFERFCLHGYYNWVVRMERGEVGPGIPDSRVVRMERGEVGPGIPDSRVVRMERGEVGPGPTLLKALMRTW